MINANEPALIIMNHRTRLDWMFFWNALYKMDPCLLTTEKIALKKQLEHIPGAGVCRCFLFSCEIYLQATFRSGDVLTL
ncbi:unnamed protein product [Gongylonema pulchrum]|uniref:PlsC domain-containing protein n=1 Tax=Gongylonema pulchrum TaxID=637853 RepID=A0A183DQB3_9BILA|nr:unnamed protein product [Gongylonema pulchrum]